MNKTAYLQQKQPPAFRHHWRRNSLGTFEKLKNNSSAHQIQQNFRRSCSSFDKIAKKQEVNQIRYEKEVDGNIYFDQNSRVTYFRNLIDSYFERSGDKGRNERMSYMMARRSIMNKKGYEVEQILKQRVKPQQKITSHFPNSQTTQQPATKNPIMTKPNHKTLSIRYKQQNLSHTTPVDRINQYLQSSNPHLQKRQSIQIFPQSSLLPKITEAVDDDNYQQIIQIPSRQEILATTSENFIKTQSSFSRFEGKKILVYENVVMRLYDSWEGQKKYRIKEFKNVIFLNRHNRALQYGMSTPWQPYKFNDLSLYMPTMLSFKDMLLKILPHPTNPHLYHIHPKPLHHNLTANNCQQLFLLFKHLIKDLNKITSKALNNKINPGNIFYANGKLGISEWEYSAFREGSEIREKHFEHRVEPILKCDKEWLVWPEYLAPEILQSVEDDKLKFDLWDYDNASDIYSIGVTFLEIITLVPMWMQHKTIVKGKIMRSREGLLSTKNRSTLRILQKQKTLVPRISAILQREVGETQKNQRFFSILLKMIQPMREKRITMTEILKQIQWQESQLQKQKAQ